MHWLEKKVTLLFFLNFIEQKLNFIENKIIFVQ